MNTTSLIFQAFGAAIEWGAEQMKKPKILTLADIMPEETDGTKVTPEMIPVTTKAISPYSKTSQPDYSGTSQLSAAGKGCIPCGQDHISVATSALSEAIRFARTGDIIHPEVVSRITIAMDELNAFERIDGAPEKVIKLPPNEKKMMDDMMAASRDIRHHITDIQNPESLEQTAALARQYRVEFMAKQIKMQKGV
jgi:hypothetical protein